MKFRYPAVPLVTHSPYFSIWSMDDVPNKSETCHWTGKPHPLTGTLRIGEREYGFLGRTSAPAMSTVSVEVSACSSQYVLDCPQAQLILRFTSPLLLDDLELLSRPVTYVSAEVLLKEAAAGSAPEVTVALSAHESICLDHPGQSPVTYRAEEGKGFAAGTLANSVQNPLNRAGDDLRIDWGTLWLAVEQGGSVTREERGDGLWAKAEKPLAGGSTCALFALAYDEEKCIQYFGEDLSPLWKTNYSSMDLLLERSFAERGEIDRRCREFDDALYREAFCHDGEAAQPWAEDSYAQLLALAYRQVIAAHCICLDPEGELLFVSKECFSNACAATADVSYPSIPLFLLYRPELVFGMMRPIMRYAASPAWPFDFAPHDAGTYPLLNGQTYSNGTDPKDQMPVEECGNMLLMTAAATRYSGDSSFADRYWELLTRWAEYLREKGMDPENQLCTDDFAGHLAHNCNLSIKAILGVAAYGQLKEARGEAGEKWLEAARAMAKSWIEEASNGDGTYRLAFDRPGTFSMKYNAIWDTLLDLGVFPAGTWDKEFLSYLDRLNPYGMPLDNRAGYTKSDWILWCASMLENRRDFERMIAPLWKAYNEMPQRVPMGDWFETLDAWQCYFQNRTVQGGLFVKLLFDRRRSREQ